MSRKSNLLKFHNIVAQDMTAGFTSPVTSIQWLDNIGIQLNVVATASPMGTFAVQVSADYFQDIEGNVVNPGNWVSVGLPSVPTVVGSSTVIYIDLNQLSSPWIRVVYTPISGDGVCDGYITAKVC